MEEQTTPKTLQASIIIASYDRANYLAMCLEALAVQTADRTTFEILIIDNCSTDNTSEVIRGFIESFPEMQVRYLFETEQGASRARNRGIRLANGELLCFLDDDTIASPDWLVNIVRGFADPSVGCVGGPAILDFQGRTVPPWLRGDLKGLLSGYGLRYCEPTEITRVAEYPFLCNMAIRKTVLDSVGLLRTDLGPTGNNLVVGEETELTERIRQAGWKVMYLPEARVLHLVSPERLEKPYIYRSSTRLAVTHIYLTWDTRFYMILRWFASDGWYATRRLFWFVLALLQRNPLWFDEYIRFWMVAKRVPLRLEALIRGKTSISMPKA